MVKRRWARFCNLKLLLVYLVVYGHWIEPGIGSSDFLLAQYRWIYLVHMPLFAFLSGLFLRDARDCARQIRRLLPLYLILQAAAVCFGGGTVRPLTPFWHLWYLLSCCGWCGAGWLWFRFGKGRGKMLILLVSLAVGCAAGFLPWLDRTLSGSRTVVFFPYFWAGLCCRGDLPWRRLRKWGFAALAAVLLVMVKVGDRIDVAFLYQAAPYSDPEQVWLRLLCYGLGFGLGLFLVTAVPDVRFPWTRAGGDTMPAYLIHAPIVRAMWELEPTPALAPVWSAALLYIIYKITQWGGGLYAIVPGERRNARWLGSRKSTTNTPSRSTASSFP